MKIVFKDSNTKFFNILICISIIVSTIIQINLFQKSFWLDEKFTILNANGLDKNGTLLFSKQDKNNLLALYRDRIKATDSFTSSKIKLSNSTNNVITANLLDNSGNNLAYFLLLNTLGDFFPLSGNLIRFISYLFWVVSIGLFFKISMLILKDVFSAKIAVILFILNPVFIRYSADARAYTMSLFFCLLGLFFLVKRIFSDDKSVKNYLLFFTTFLLSVFSHYLTIFFYLACFLFEFFSNSDFTRKRNTTIFYALITVIVSLVVIVINSDGFKVMNDISMLQRRSMHTSLVSSYIANFIGYLGGTIEIFLSFFGCLFSNIGIRSRQYFPVILFLVPFFIYSIGVSRKAMYWFILIPLFSAIVMAVLSGHASSFVVRYYLWFIPVVLISLAEYFSITGLKNFKSKIVLVGIFLFYSTSFLSLYLDYPLRRTTDMYQSISNDLIFEDVNKIYYTNVKNAMMFNLYNNIPESITQQVIADSSHFMRLINSDGETTQYVKLDPIVKEW